MSMQAFGILAKVTEVDELLNVQTHSREIVREVHPEVCFFLLNGNQPLAFTKKKAEGRRERLALLRSWCGSEADTLVAQRSNLSCKADDIIDALGTLDGGANLARSGAHAACYPST